MGFGSPPPEDQIKTLNAILFFVAMSALWTVAHALLGGLFVSGGVWMVLILFGVFFGYPMTAVVGLLEYLSARIARGLLARLLFLLFAAGAFFAFLYFSTTAKISDHKDMWYFNFQINFQMLGPGTLLVVLGYLIRGFWRDEPVEQSPVA